MYFTTFISYFFFQYIFSHFYNPGDAQDKCTLSSDRNLINRRNVRSDVSKNISTCKKFLTIELQARIVGATMIDLGIKEMDEKPSSNSLYANMKSLPKKAQRDCLKSLTEKVVDKYILGKDKVQNILEQTCKAQEEENTTKATGDRFPCRFPGCVKSFKHDGKRRRDHEKSHDGFLIEDSTKTRAITTSKNNADYRYNYQCSFM